MVPGLSGNGYAMPENLRDVLRRDPESDPWAGFTAAQVLAGAGFPVLPCTPGGKTPLAWGPFRNGARSATTDREIVRNAFVENPDANVAIAPDGSFVVLDIDPRNGGSLAAAEALGLPVDGYRERSGSGGWHIPTVMPSGHRAERSTTLGPGLEIKGRGSYVVSPHSRLDGAGWYRPETGRDVWRWGAIPATWEHLHQLTKREGEVEIFTTPATQQDRQTASTVLDDLLSGPFGHNVAHLVAGEWQQVRNDDGSPRYPSQSEADLGLMSMCVWGAKGNPTVLDQAMRQTKLFRPKWDRSRGEETYGQRTVSRAIASSRWSPTATRQPKTVFIGTSGRGGLSRADRQREIVRLVTVATERDAEGFARVPVGELATSLGVNRKTITRDLAGLEASGLLVTTCRNVSHLRRKRWARLTERGTSP